MSPRVTRHNVAWPQVLAGVSARALTHVSTDLLYRTLRCTPRHVSAWTRVARLHHDAARALADAPQYAVLGSDGNARDADGALPHVIARTARAAAHYVSAEVRRVLRLHSFTQRGAASVHARAGIV
jgi:hypothetical protein